jgi:hypothetical protein
MGTPPSDATLQYDPTKSPEFPEYVPEQHRNVRSTSLVPVLKRACVYTGKLSKTFVRTTFYFSTLTHSEELNIEPSFG